LIHEGELFIPGQKGTSDVHATGANPDIIDGYFVPFLLQGTINQPKRCKKSITSITPTLPSPEGVKKLG
jgi:hypothetical protein